MGKSQSAKQRVVDYFMSIHLGVSLSADSIEGIYVNDRPAWTGSMSEPGQISVNLPNLFGGPQKEGGLVGTIYHFPGHADQVIPPEVASRFGRTPETMPAFRGLTTLFFCGGSGWTAPTNAALPGFPGSVVNKVVNQAVGAQYQGGQGGFKWTSNSPLVAQKLAVKARRAPKTGLNPAHAMIGPNANPAHMIYECLTNVEWGMGSARPTIDHDSFNAGGAVLFDEAFGLSMAWFRQTEIETFIQEVCDHIQAVVFVHPRTGLWTLKLIRDDYDISTLRHITPDNAELSNFDRRMWGEVTNEVTVTWTNPLNEQDETVTAHDLASNFIQGSPIPASRNFYGIRDRSLAMKVAQREVRSSSAALASCNAALDRRGWDCTPGEVVIVTWPEYQLNGVIMRVGQVGYGKKGDGRIKLALMEDIFSLEKPPINVPPGTAWEQPGSVPAPLAAMEVITIPAYFAMSGDFQSAAIDLEYPEVIAGVFGYQNDPDTVSFELLSEGVASTGEAAFYPAGTKSVIERTILADPLPQELESRIPHATVINKVRGPRVGGFVWLGAGSDQNMEIAQVIAFDEEEEEWIIARGVLDTIPRPWPVGSPVWFVNPGTRIADDRTLRSAGEEIDYKFLTRTSRGVLPAADAPTITETLTARPHLPLRPANVKINGEAWANVQGNAPLVITWATRNRLLEDGQVVRWGAGPVPPEYAQGTIVSVVAGGQIVYEQKLWTENTVTLDPAWFARWPEARIYVSSRRDGLDSLQAHSIGVVGLANNPNAPPPPVPPDPGPPPAYGAAPAVGAWSAIGYAFEKNEAGKVIGSVPAILVSGVRDRPDAVGLIVRYAVKGSDDWFVLPTVTINDAPAQAATTAVRPQTIYVVEVAYADANGTMSQWRSLGEVLTGALSATHLGDLDYATVKRAVDFLEQIGGEGEALEGVFAEIISGVNLTAEGIMAEILRDSDDKARFEKLLHLPDGKTIGNVLATEIETRESEKEAYQLKFDVMGSVGPDGDSWIFNAQKTYWAPGKSFASIEQSIISTVEQSSATIQRTAETAVTASEATAKALAVLGSANATGTAFNIRFDRTYAGNGQLISEYINGVATTAASGASAYAIQQSKAYVDNGSPFAQVMSQLGVTTPQGFLARITETQQVSEAGAMVGLRLQYGNKVTGYVMTNTGEQGDIVWLQDKFIIATPQGDKIPFQVDTRTGRTRLAEVDVSGDAFIDGTLTASKIVGGALSNMKSFRNLGVVNVPAGQGHQVMHLEFNFTTDGGPISLVVYGEIGSPTNLASGITIFVDIDGVRQQESGAIYCPGSWGGIGTSFPCGREDLPPGDHNFKIWYIVPSGGANSGASRINRTNCTIFELKKTGPGART